MKNIYKKEDYIYKDQEIYILMNKKKNNNNI